MTLGGAVVAVGFEQLGGTVVAEVTVGVGPVPWSRKVAVTVVWL
jgi:hypothetical protein